LACAANARKTFAFQGNLQEMLQKRHRTKDLAALEQSLRGFVVGVRTLTRRARVVAWRFKRNSVLRDRTARNVTFALLAAFTIASVDYLVTGGPEWNPGEAYAMPMPQTPQARTVQRATTPVVEPLPVIEPAELETIDYSVTTETLLGGPEIVFASLDPLTGKPIAHAPTIEAGKGKDI
jgi:hypothetical protein